MVSNIMGANKVMVSKHMANKDMDSRVMDSKDKIMDSKGMEDRIGSNLIMGNKGTASNTQEILINDLL